jgi:hypothetical protein
MSFSGAVLWYWESWQRFDNSSGSFIRNSNCRLRGVHQSEGTLVISEKRRCRESQANALSLHRIQLLIRVRRRGCQFSSEFVRGENAIISGIFRQKTEELKETDWSKSISSDNLQIYFSFPEAAVGPTIERENQLLQILATLSLFPYSIHVGVDIGREAMAVTVEMA